MIDNLLAILFLCFFCFLFWQQRRQSELAKAAIAESVKELDLQLLSVAFSGLKLKMRHELTTIWRWHHLPIWVFSVRDDCYKGEIDHGRFPFYAVWATAS